MFRSIWDTDNAGVDSDASLTGMQPLVGQKCKGFLIISTKQNPFLQQSQAPNAHEIVHQRMGSSARERILALHVVRDEHVLFTETVLDARGTRHLQ